MTLSVAEASRKRVSTLRGRRGPGTVCVCLLAIQGHGAARWKDRASPGDYVQTSREVTGCPTALTGAGWRWPPWGALTVSDDLSRVRGFRRSPATQASRSAFAKLNAVAHLCAGHLCELNRGCDWSVSTSQEGVPPFWPPPATNPATTFALFAQIRPQPLEIIENQ